MTPLNSWYIFRIYVKFSKTSQKTSKMYPKIQYKSHANIALLRSPTLLLLSTILDKNTWYESKLFLQRFQSFFMSFKNAPSPHTTVFILYVLTGDNHLMLKSTLGGWVRGKLPGSWCATYERCIF